MATKGEPGDVPPPWGAWLAFGVAMVCSGGLPAVAWAGCCCCGEGRPSPLWGRCGPLGVTHAPCNGHPTRRGPGKGRLWVGGGMGPCAVHVVQALVLGSFMSHAHRARVSCVWAAGMDQLPVGQ